MTEIKKKICRLCLNKSKNMRTFSNSTQIIRIVRHLTGLELKSSKSLPNHICELCWSITESIEKFRNTCRNSEKLLQTIEETDEAELELGEKRIYLKEVLQFSEVTILKLGTYQSSADIEPEYIAHRENKQSIDELATLDAQQLAEKLKTILPSETIIKSKISTKNSQNGQDSTISVLQTHGKPSEGYHISQIDEDSLVHRKRLHLKPPILKISRKQSEKKVAVLKDKKINRAPRLKIPCEICGVTIYRSLLKYHMYTHEDKKPFSCTESSCMVSFSNPRSLRSHVKNVHHPEYKFECEICGKKFNRKPTLKVHLQYHLDPTIPCELCGKLFATKEAVKTHSIVHTGERPYGCSFCYKKFQTKKTLRIHERIHTGETPYVCELCGAAFYVNCLLKNHKEKLH